MRIALYYPWIYLRSGVERTILELTKRSRHQWTILTSHFDADSTYPEFKERKIIELKRVSVSRSYPAVLKAALTILFQKIDLKDYDALWVHSEGLGDLITFRNHQKPVICFCHTPLKVIHDRFARDVYLKNNQIKKAFFVLFTAFFKFIDRLAWQNYHHVFSVSQEVKNRILRAGLAPAKNIEIIYGGVDTEKIKPSWNYDPYFFHPARIKWWKNIELSIEAFGLLQKKYPQFHNFKLIIAGQLDKGSKSYYERLAMLYRPLKNIQIIINPSSMQFDRLYSNCCAVLSATLNEDWGLVPLEAMAYGKPTIAVNQGGPKESIMHNKTGFLVRPTPEEFADAMRMLAGDKDLVLEMGKASREASLKYSWDNFVRHTDECLESLLL